MRNTNSLNVYNVMKMTLFPSQTWSFHSQHAVEKSMITHFKLGVVPLPSIYLDRQMEEDSLSCRHNKQHKIDELVG